MGSMTHFGHEIKAIFCTVYIYSTDLSRDCKNGPIHISWNGEV